MIRTADAALAAQKKQVEVRDLRLQESDKQIAGLSKELTDLKISQDRWYKSQWLWLAVGLVAGGLVVGEFK